MWLGQVEAFVRAVAAGSWPLWDASVCFGQPRLADPSSQVAYPPAWLNLIVPLRPAYTLYAVSHVAFSALGFFVLCRTLGLSRLASLAGAAIWEASGPLLSLVNVWHHFGGAAWMPWVLAAGHRTFLAPEARSAFLWGGAMAAQILAGSADMCAMTAAATTMDGLRHLRVRAGGWRENRRLLGWTVAAWALALGLSAVLWLPALDGARRSARWGLPAEMRTAWSVHPAALLQTVVPLSLHELPLREADEVALVGSREPFLLSLYLGLPALALVLAAAGRPHARFVGLLGAAAALIALGRHAPFYAVAAGLLPPLQILRYPMKAMIMVAVAWAFLAGAGLDAWANTGVGSGGRPARLPRILCQVLAALSLAVGLLFRYRAAEIAGFFDAASAAGLQHALAPSAIRLILAGILTAAVIALAALRARLGPAVGAALVMAVLDLIVAHRDVNPTAPAELYTFRPQTVDALKTVEWPRVYVYEYQLLGGRGHLRLEHTDPEIARRLRADPYVTRLPFGEKDHKVTQALAYQMYLIPPLPGRWDLSGAFDVDIRGLYPAPLADLTAALRAVEETPAHLRLLRLGGVTHVVALHQRGFEDLVPVAVIPGLFVPDIRVYRVPDPLPRAYAVASVRIAEGAAALRTLVEEGFEADREVVLAPGSGIPGGAAFDRAQTAGTVRILEARPDRVRIEAEMRAPGYVVLLDSYDPGWKARVDGRDAPVLRANTAFRAVPVAAGRHVVEQVYRPRAFMVGGALSLASLLAAALLARGRRGHGSARGAP